MTRLGILVAAVVVVASASVCLAGEIGFTEDFALAKDRAEALKLLIPGTQDHYYYTCIHLQNTGKLDDVDKTLAEWIKRHNRSPRVDEIENRQALLRYEKSPDATLSFLKTRLNLQFNHQKELLNQKPTLPTSLDEKLISRETLTPVAFSRHPGSVDGFEDCALEWLAATNLNGDLRRHLLSRLQRPDLANLTELVLADLKHPNSGGFGQHGIHRSMLQAQLDDLLKADAGLLNQTNFVHACLTKLHPGNDSDWRHDAKEREAYLDRLWGFVKQLAPVHNSLKASVLYHRLMHDRALGVWDKDRFMTYIQLPRPVPYMNPKYLERPEHVNRSADLQADFSGVTMLGPIRSDEPLVRSYLLHFFVEEDSYKPYEPYINDLYLKDCFAEAKIVNGIGEVEKWYPLISPQRLQELKERIDLDFAEQNKTHFGPGEDVNLDIHVKNVKTMIVKVYQVNAMNYYRTVGREVSTDINLDGLVANEEKVYTYNEIPLRRVKRPFTFPTLKSRGTYVVEFIGGGKSSRALVSKGRLRYLVRSSPAGHVFTIMDEAGRKLTDATLWLGGKEYRGDKDGYVAVPFSNSPGDQPIILTQGDFATLDRFAHQAEVYNLVGSFHVERESLLRRKKAGVVIRAALYANNAPVSLSLLEEVTLVIASVDQEGVSTTKEIPNFKLYEDRESTAEFQVPENLSGVQFLLKAKVQNLSQNKKVDLAASQGFFLNNIDKTDKVEDLHLMHVEGKYALEVLGKTGEVKPDRPVNLEFKHRDFRDTVNTSLQTDKQGRIALGAMKDVVWVRATGPEKTSHVWATVKDQRSCHSNIHGKVGDAVNVPYVGQAQEVAQAEFSLLEIRDGTFVKDWLTSLKLKDGFLVVQDLPAGDYELRIKSTGASFSIRLTDGAVNERHVLGANRYLETQNARPLQIVSVTADKDNVRIQLANASKLSRVHVAATRYLPEYPIYSDLLSPGLPEPGTIAIPKPESLYISGRNIGDEYRYILDRKYTKKLPGNMLTRPGLLLNPWAIRKTETTVHEAAAGEELAALRADAPGGRSSFFGGGGKPRPAPDQNFANLDFLGEQAVVLVNLQADEKGVVTVARKLLGAHQQVHVLAVDPANTVYRELSLPEVKMDFIDLRLRDGLDGQKHFTEQKQISIVGKNTDFVVADIASSRVEPYDSLPKAYGLYVTLSNNPTLIEFNFITRWPTLKPEQKQELYSKYACHELNFFLSKKDPAFFEKVVQPYLRNKKDKTFLDHWLLNDDLSAYAKPWAFNQLNAVERILLAQRLKDAETPRHIKSLWDLIPPNIEQFNHLFKTALKGSALETGDALGLQKAMEELKPENKLKSVDKSGGQGVPSEAPVVATAAARPAAPPAGPAGTGRGGRGEPAKVPADGKDRAAAEADSFRDAGKKRQAEAGKAELELADLKEDLGRRREVRQLYRKLDKTEEWVENNYYHLPIEAQNASLVTVNGFWKDYASFDGRGEFFSNNFAEASRNFTEMMLALSVMDLPFDAGKHETSFKAAEMTLKTGSPMVVFHRQVKDAKAAAEKTPILVSQNFFRHNDRYAFVNNERLDKYVTEEFLTHSVHGCQVVITNPTSSPQKLDVLLQVPRGAIPVLKSLQTRSVTVDLQPYSTTTLEYYFYFPMPGEFEHYPVHVAKNGVLIAFAAPVKLKAVDMLAKIDKTAWDYLSQHGTGEEVLSYLKEQNLHRIDLSRIAFRMQDKAYFGLVIPLLAGRHAYDHTLWSYSIKHNEPDAVREYLQYCEPFVNQCGAYIDTRLLTIDPVIRKSYQHMEYSPLVNARAHKLGKTRTILNDRFSEQYQRLMRVLGYRPALDNDDLMAVTYYMLLQDRVEDATGFFARVDAKKLATTLQHDYFTAYIDFYSDDHKLARGIATKYADYPVDRWRKLFANVAAQLDEVEGKGPKVVDEKDREQAQAKLAAGEPTFEFKVEAKQIQLNFQNLTEVRVNYYLMDIELLFSRNPFVQQHTGQFAFIRPNKSELVKLPDKKTSHTFDLPKDFHSSNVMVEIEAAGVKKSQAYFSNSLVVQLLETYGQLKVTQEKTGKDLPKVYVKAYAKMKDGSVRFYKDGYTDLRGKFDYTSLSTTELDNVERFSLLILSETDGAVVREAAPPKQ